ncbi:hypothetical protein OVA24_04015 [Luteolibacter sp. SL250]|uniref:hypothetical protein n=1 Tax=Luteolibacter sp. SL250 TaxID=2995170 RepID=UPI00226E40E2|nr:hypothetical protein [Luteolibacter sp. SL250]WAC20544.1 hypothetical protein OVA24_04015 [Luteolibacter sp. SL250]
MIRPAIIIASFASLLLTAVPSRAQFEVTHPAIAGAEKSASAVTADRRHMVAVLSGTTPSALTVYRQVSDQPSVAWDAVTSFALDSQAPYHYRVKSGNSTTWVAWQGEPTAGGARIIQIRRVFPTVGPVEMVTGSADQASGFDLAIDDQDRPCIASYRTTTAAQPNLVPFIRIHRRSASGTWEYELAASYEEEMIAKPEEIAITTRGNKIHVFDVAWAQITFSGISLRQSTLYHTEINAPGTLAAATYDFRTVANETSSTSEGLRPAIFRVSAAVAPDGAPAVSYSHTGSKQVKYSALRGSTWTGETLVQPNGEITAEYLDETQIGIDPAGRAQVAWRSSTSGSLARSARLSGGWSTRTVSTTKLANPSFTLDALGNAHYSGVDLTVPGRVTALRPSAITDADGNGYTRLEEDAFLMPGGGSTANAPAQLIVTVDGKRYPAIRYYSSPEAFAAPANPFTNGGYQYTVEISTDLVTWTTAPSSLVHHQTDTENPEHTMSIWRSSVPLDENPKQFLRMRVNGPD